MLPRTLALVDDDREYAEFLSEYLRVSGVAVDVFADSNDLLIAKNAFNYAFYLIDLVLPGIDGLNLIKILKARTGAGIVVISGRLGPDVFQQVMTAGADMYLSKPVNFEQVVLAVTAVQRRANAAPQSDGAAWRLDPRQQQLVAPDGACISLSDSDLAVMHCFAEAHGAAVTRELLRARLGQDVNAEIDSLNATIYRLRRRIERATSAAMPLQAKSRVGYVFRAALELER